MMPDLHEADRLCVAECAEAAQRLGALVTLLHGLYDFGEIEALIDDLRGVAQAATPGGPGMGSTVHRGALAVLGRTYTPPTRPEPMPDPARYPVTCPVCLRPAYAAAADDQPGVRYRHPPGPLGDTPCRYQPGEPHQ